MSRLKHEKYVFAWSRIRSGSVKALGCLGNLKQFHHERRNVASPGAGKAPCLAPAAQANNWLLSWWSTRNLPYWFKQKEKKNALRTLFLLCSGAYTFQRAVLLGLSPEEAGGMDLTCEVSENATAKSPKSTTEKLPGLIWITGYSTTLLIHICFLWD